MPPAARTAATAAVDPADLAEAVRRWARPLVENLAGSFVSFYLYGSAVEPGFAPARSDVNVLLVARSLPASTLAALAAAWPGDRVLGARVNPALLTQDQIPRSLDSFALELADVRARGRLLEGEDVLAGIHVPAAALRTHVERELRMIVARLRRAYLAGRAVPGGAATALAAAAGSLAACARGLAYVNGTPVPLGAEAALQSAAAWAGVEARPWLEAWRLRAEGDLPASADALLLDFLDAAERFLQRVDTLAVAER